MDEKRSKEELLQYIGDAEDLPFMYKIVANNTIMKFNINLNDKFDIDKD